MKKSLIMVFCLFISWLWLAACTRPMLQPPITPTNPPGNPTATRADISEATSTPTSITAQSTTQKATPTSSVQIPTSVSTTQRPAQTPTPTSRLLVTPLWCPVTPVTEPVTGTLRVVYSHLGQLWVQDEHHSPIRLGNSQNVSQVSLSRDGKIVVYTRQLNDHQVELWAINTDGSQDRRLLSASDLTQLDGSSDALGVLPTALQWEPQGHRLSFFTYPLYEALWIFEPSHPWLVDLDHGGVSPASYTGGNIQFSPDGKWVAIYNSRGLSLVKIDGSDRKEDVLPGYHGIGEGESYYDPLPFWSPDSTSLLVALPDQDDLYNPNSTVTIWRVPVNGTPTILGQLRAFAPSVRFSPDQTYMIDYPWPTGAANQRQLHLVRLPGGQSKTSSDIRYADGELVDNLAWSPDSQHFLFSTSDLENKNFQFYLGRICQPSQDLIETNSSGTAEWVDARRFLLALGNPDISAQRELRLGTIGQPQTDLLGTVTAYDWVIMP